MHDASLNLRGDATKFNARLFIFSPRQQPFLLIKMRSCCQAFFFLSCPLIPPRTYQFWNTRHRNLSRQKLFSLLLPNPLSYFLLFLCCLDRPSLNLPMCVYKSPSQQASELPARLSRSLNVLVLVLLPPLILAIYWPSACVVLIQDLFGYFEGCARILLEESAQLDRFTSLARKGVGSRQHGVCIDKISYLIFALYTFHSINQGGTCPEYRHYKHTTQYIRKMGRRKSDTYLKKIEIEAKFNGYILKLVEVNLLWFVQINGTLFVHVYQALL